MLRRDLIPVITYNCTIWIHLTYYKSIFISVINNRNRENKNVKPRQDQLNCFPLAEFYSVRACDINGLLLFYFYENAIQYFAVPSN